MNVWAILAAIVVVVGLIGGVYFHGKKVEGLEAKSDVADIAAEVQEKKDEVRNLPRGLDITIGELRSGSF